MYMSGRSSTNFRITATVTEHSALPRDTNVIWQAICTPNISSTAQYIRSAEAAKSAFAVIKEHMKTFEWEQKKGETVILASVKGDIHDIGKNIVKVLLENYGFEVIDLGRDVPPEKIVDAVVKEHAKAVGLSALMTTTVPAMEETIRLLKRTAPSVKVAVGGAVLTKEYADSIGADAYCKDAMATVNYLLDITNW